MNATTIAVMEVSHGRVVMFGPELLFSMYKCCFFACFCARQRAQRLRAELTLAQLREKLPNGWTDWHQIWHICAYSYGNGYTQNKLPLETQGHMWGLGVNNSKVWGSCQSATTIGTQFGTRLRIRLGMDMGKTQFAPQYPKGHF